MVLAPYEYLASKPGKEVRGQLIEALNLWLSVPGEKIRNVHNVISMLHTSSLLFVLFVWKMGGSYIGLTCCK